ncbi:MAG: thermonuclease family protein [Desulfobacterales bacterium]|nr:thermonuclease family protein [Desulfobacterales bacterium]
MKRLITILLVWMLFFLFQQASRAVSWNQVKWVVDGDTVVLNDGQKVRYIGINAPELAHDDHGAEPYGEASKEFNALLVARKKVRLEFDKERFDRYQRLLAYVFLKNAKFVNAEILSTGYAYLLKHRPNLKYDEILLQAQRSAMSAKRGIWQNWKENKNTVIGNKNSHRFHLRTCPYGKRIKPRNRIVFQKKWDAYWEGYAPAKRCMPVFEIPGN